MTKAVHILLIILTLGIFLTPSQAYACKTHSVKTEKSCEESPCCKKEKKDCCKNHKSESHKDHNNCGGKCGDSSCHCPTVNFFFTLPFVLEMTNDDLRIAKTKQKFYHKETYLSSGFYAIWTPPNIG